MLGKEGALGWGWGEERSLVSALLRPGLNLCPPPLTFLGFCVPCEVTLEDAFFSLVLLG